MISNDLDLPSGGLPTIRHVARKASVSPATVSMVLNNNPRISAPVREQVMSAVRELDYRRRAAGRPATRREGAPARGYRHPKGVFLIDSPVFPQAEAGRTLYTELYLGVQETLRSRGIDLIQQTVDGGHWPLEAVGGIRVGEMDGTSRLARGRPLVRTMGEPDRREACDHLTYDNRGVGELAADFCLERGYRRVAMVWCLNIFSQRCQAMAERLRAAGTEVWTSEPVLHGDLYGSPKRFERLLGELLGRQRPELLFFPADDLTAMAYPLLYRLGFHPGEGFDVLSCNNDYSALNGLNPRPHVIDIRMRVLGNMAAEQLLRRRERPEEEWVKVRVSPVLLTREEWPEWSERWRRSLPKG